MKRKALHDLKIWQDKSTRKPLILRGARQVGKSTLVRLFCQQEQLDLIEFNLEIETLNSIKRDNFIFQELLDEIQLKKQTHITDNSLVFFDEIQEAPQLLKLLRYFYENAPWIKVIAAGSLLEIALKAENFSFPVGRVEFYHLGPMTFQEFLWATKQEFLEQKLYQLEFGSEVHQAALLALKQYYYVGGMPAAVKKFSETGSFVEIRDIHNQILQTYQADFPKYNRRINLQRISRIFNSLALNTGVKIIYSKLDPESNSRDIKRVVELLIDARVILPCIHSDGNNVPLLGESDAKIFKIYFLDIGLLNALFKLDIDTLDSEFKSNFNTKGILAEQFVAQHLQLFYGPTISPSLIYHLRDKGHKKAEIDFLIEQKNSIYPIEVKSSAKGHLKSLQYFCQAKNSSYGVKMSLAPFSVDDNFINQAKLLSLPLYSVNYLQKILEQLESSSLQPPSSRAGAESE